MQKMTCYIKEEYLDMKEPNKRKKIMEVSDYHIMNFAELTGLFL